MNLSRTPLQPEKRTGVEQQEYRHERRGEEERACVPGRFSDLLLGEPVGEPTRGDFGERRQEEPQDDHDEDEVPRVVFSSDDPV